MERIANYLFPHGSNSHGHHENPKFTEFLGNPMSLSKIPCGNGVLDICLVGKDKVGVCSYLKKELNVYDISGTHLDSLPCTGNPQYLSRNDGIIVYTELDGNNVFKTEYTPKIKDVKDVEMESEKGNSEESKNKNSNPTYSTESEKHSKASKIQSEGNAKENLEEKMEVDDQKKKTRRGRKVKEGTTERNKKASNILIKEEWIPRGIHCTESGEMIICLWNGLRGEKSRGKVVKYCKDGKLLNKYESHRHKSLYARPMYVTESDHGDICVSDWEMKSVIVVNQSGAKKFQYEGRKMQNDEELEFDPRGLCTDSYNNIIIADYWSHRLHVLDKNGHFIRFLLEESTRGPTGICIDENNLLYICELGGESINVIKYLKEPIKPE
jgi:hypothetical protein